MKVHFKDTFNVAVDHVSQKMIGQDNDKSGPFLLNSY